jgi:tetraacyldisaccharide 4'-kinase
VRRDEPSWWYGEQPEHVAAGLTPVAWLYGWVAQARFTLTRPYRSRLPVLCAGNFTAGGSGKTPLTRYLCECVLSLGKRPVVLSRGYGGHLSGPHWVQQEDRARDVGDEPLLLARTVPVVVARNRIAGARAIEASPNADVIVMDDGLQNPALHKNLAVAIVDRSRGLGNRKVIPAGPLRAPLKFQLKLVDAIVLNRTNPDCCDVVELSTERIDTLVFSSATIPADDTAWLKGRPIIAWAGIAGPARFFGLLDRLGAVTIERFTFPDHVSPSADQALRMLQAAHAAGADLISTEKDLARIAGESDALSELAKVTRVLPIRLAFDPPDADQLTGLVASAISTRRPKQ